MWHEFVTTKKPPTLKPTAKPDEKNDSKVETAEARKARLEKEAKDGLDLKRSLHISWSAPVNSPLPVYAYTVQYRTFGSWVPFTENVNAPTTYFIWKRPSWGISYFFRVISLSNNSESLPSAEVMFNTSDPMIGFITASTSGIIGTVVGSMTTFIGCMVCTIFLSKQFKKRKLKRVEKKRLKQEADDATMTINTSVGRALEGRESPLLDVRLAVDNHVMAGSSNHNSIEFTTTPILETPI
ncbi:hypothetical protein HELRODRAFT_169584 [Helobdella robusta]|uniref:Fibronectin type-III domain-containing protein n=1 Tax=Helobdella robusta TaxID=6412 RepID=T1F250_HELRO|nr:hypothetical protein HELRODRAFT_169584 [Helobdella robusta]ESO07886.1 hypothetical protein HELRODRAFT_169584 [Helobdella robusta]